MPTIRILAVDDDPHFLTTLHADLSRRGYSCATACVASTAKVMLERLHPFDLILLGTRLTGQAGWELLRDLRRSGRKTPVMFLSDVDQVEDRIRALRLGAEDFVPKQLPREELVERIETCLDRSLGVAALESSGEGWLHAAAERAGRAGRMWGPAGTF